MPNKFFPFLPFVLLNLILTLFSVSSLKAAILKNMPSKAGKSFSLLNRAIRHSYDSEGLLIQKILPDSSSISYKYQGDRLAKITDPSERIQEFLGDEYGRITQKISPQNEVWPQSYDSASLLEHTSFPEGGSLLTRYDSLNRPEKLIDRAGAERLFSYTPQDRGIY